MEVDYELDKNNDVALLSKVNNLNTVFWGQLLNEKTKVAATIEDLSNPDDIEVMKSIPVLDRHYYCYLNSSPIIIPIKYLIQ